MSLWALVALAVALCAAFLAGLVVGLDRPAWARRFLPERRPRDPHHTRHPVVLVHGLLGFDELRVAGGTHEYFRGVQRHLESLGARVHCVRLPPVASVEERARALEAFVRSLDAPKVNLVAHSMGGLDARYAIARLGMRERVASLVTVATPHRGTPIADEGTKWMDRLALRKIGGAMGLRLDAFHDLTVEHMRRVNDEVRDATGVFYACVVARAPTDPHPLLRATRLFLASRTGESDGLVPVESQVWGEVIGDVRSDHWGVVGWGVSEIGAPELYASVVRALVQRGH